MTTADLSRQACRLADSVTQLVVTYKDLIGAALGAVTWQRGHMTVGLVTRALIQAWEEAHEVREMLR